MRNDKTFCGAPIVESNSCLICRYSVLRKFDHERFKKLFDKYDFTYYFPSEFAKKLWLRSFDEVNEKLFVNNHFKMTDTESRVDHKFSQRKNNSSLRIAFVGHHDPKKGWFVWRDFIDNRTDISSKYECFHLGKTNSAGREKHFNVSVSPGNRLAMIDALANNKIDIVLLWSIWPETYSYVLHEAVAAGCYVLTHENSGNVASEVEKNNWGKIFESIDDLYAYLESPDNVKDDIVEFFEVNPYRKSLSLNIQTPVHFGLNSPNKVLL